MINSMTGFGRNQTNYSGTDLSVEINSVNRRNLELSVSLPREWQPLDREIQSLLRGAFARGKLHVSIQAQCAASESGFHWDEAGLESSLRRLGEFAAKKGIEWPPGADALVRLAALNKVEVLLPTADEIADSLMESVRQALGELKGMRKTEGKALEDDLQERLSSLRTSLQRIREESASTVGRFREVLFQRLGQAELDIDLSDERVLKEIAIFADKCDISEELTRLESHFEQFSGCLATGSPIGRKLEFILQEVNREFNTIGSKSSNVEVSREVIEAKNEIERIREQIQNIE